MISTISLGGDGGHGLSVNPMEARAVAGRRDTARRQAGVPVGMVSGPRANHRIARSRQAGRTRGDVWDKPFSDGCLHGRPPLLGRVGSVQQAGSAAVFLAAAEVAEA